MQTVVETPSFIRRAERLLSEDEHAALITFLASHPYADDEIVGAGGVRKVRFAAMAKGKSGGVRVIHYCRGRDTPIHALLVYGARASARI